MPPLGWDRQSTHTIVEWLAIEHDPAGVRLHRAGDGLQREALARARGTEKHDEPVIDGKSHIETETVERLLEPDFKHRYRLPLTLPGGVHRALLPSRGLRQSAGTTTPHPMLHTIRQGEHPKGEHQEKKRRLAGGGIVQRLYLVINGDGDGTGDPRDVAPYHQDYPKLSYRMGEA